MVSIPLFSVQQIAHLRFSTHSEFYSDFSFFFHRIFIILIFCSSMQDTLGKKKASRPCEGCGMSLPFKMTKKLKIAIPGGQFLCKTCARVRMTCLFIQCFLYKFSKRNTLLKVLSVIYSVYQSQLYAILLQLTKSNHYCGICKKIWNHPDSGSWVRQPTIYSKVLIFLLLLVPSAGI